MKLQADLTQSFPRMNLLVKFAYLSCDKRKDFIYEFTTLLNQEFVRPFQSRK